MAAGGIGLSEGERSMLAALVAARGRAVASGSLEGSDWDWERPAASSKAVAMRASRLRRKLALLGCDPACVAAVRGFGYRYDASRDPGGRARALCGRDPEGPTLLDQGRGLA